MEYEYSRGIGNFEMSAFRKSKSLHFYDVGPNGNYLESLKALRAHGVADARRVFVSQKTYTYFSGVFETSKA